MSETSERRRLRAEARTYGMAPKRGVSAAELDRQIQSKVSRDMDRGVCSACRKPMHGGSC